MSRAITSIKKEDIKKTTICMPKDLYLQLRIKALEEQTTVSELITKYCKNQI